MMMFEFGQLPSGQLIQVDSNDTISFHGGSAATAAVTFGVTMGDISVVNVSFGGHTVEFDFGVVNTAANMNLLFDDGSHLLIGGPRNEAYEGSAGADGMYGGDGADTLAGHGGANVLQGNQGNDSITAEGGSDTIYGGQGNDVIVSGLGVGAETTEIVNGNKGDDTITGGNGNDLLFGGQGNDSIQGGGGDDWMSGDLGDDTLSGGSGGDVFFALHNGGDDRVLDFNGAEGDRVRVEAGVPFDIHQDGMDTLILIGHGSSTMRLVGVDMSTLHADWIVNV
jgi:Ca2+-binding RTX toxin-like protein